MTFGLGIIGVELQSAAAAGSDTGASRAVFAYAAAQNWSLVSSPYALNEVLHNLEKLSANE